MALWLIDVPLSTEQSTQMVFNSYINFIYFYTDIQNIFLKNCLSLSYRNLDCKETFLEMAL